MQPTTGRQPFTDRHWVFEFKLEGIRAMAYCDHGTVKILDKALKDITHKYPQITTALKKWPVAAVIDGEIVALDDHGISDLQALKRWKSDDDGPLYYFAFDLLWMYGIDYKGKPLYSRKSTLKNILPISPVIIYHSEIVSYGEACFKTAVNEGMAGIMAKRIDSKYQPGTRSKDWVQIPVRVPVNRTVKSKKH
jgi:bifunctional non-homologous end joining protein LigD